MTSQNSGTRGGRGRHGPNVWVVRRGKRFAVRRERDPHCLTGEMTQRRAMDIARGEARRNRSELIVQGRNGRIRSKDSHGFDDFPPRG